MEENVQPFGQVQVPSSPALDPFICLFPMNLLFPSPHQNTPGIEERGSDHESAMVWAQVIQPVQSHTGRIQIQCLLGSGLIFPGTELPLLREKQLRTESTAEFSSN